MLILKTPILLLTLNIVKKALSFVQEFTKKISLMIELIKLIPRVQMLRPFKLPKLHPYSIYTFLIIHMSP